MHFKLESKRSDDHLSIYWSSSQYYIQTTTLGHLPFGTSHPLGIHISLHQRIVLSQTYHINSALIEVDLKIHCIRDIA